MSDDIFAEHIRRQIQEDKAPKPARKPMSRAGRVRAWCVLAVCLAAFSLGLAELAQIIVH